ncbi:hypothetical protein GCM10028798_24010 [Humibacter antri]
MIIDSGWDLLFLTKRRLWKRTEQSPLVVVAMTGDLELYLVKTVAKNYSGRLDDHHDSIFRAIDKDFVRYFAVAHRSAEARHDLIDFNQAKRLEQAAKKVGLHLIGELHVDHEYWCSTGPISTFKTYFEDDLPKIISRRPRRFAKTRLAGGSERDAPDDSVYQRFTYELDGCHAASLSDGALHV